MPEINMDLALFQAIAAPLRHALFIGACLGIAVFARRRGSLGLAAAAGAFMLAAGQTSAELWRPVALICLAGLAGSVLDSLLGATLQAKYISHETGELTEKPRQNGRSNRLHSSLRFVSNDLVNFASSLLAAALVLVIP